MTEKEAAVLESIKQYSILLKIYFGIIILSFVTVILISLLLVLLSLWTNLMLFLYILLLFFTGAGGVVSAIIDDFKWSLFSGICRRMKRNVTVESYECWKNDLGL